MASDAVLLQSFLEKNDLTFEQFIKNLLNGDVVFDFGTEAFKIRLDKLANSIRYWAKKMKKVMTDKRVLFTTFSPDEEASVSQTQIFEELQKIIDLNLITEVYQPENNRYLGIEFAEKEQSELVFKSMQKVGNAFVIFLKWGLQYQIHKARVHWIPSDVDHCKVRDFVANYFNISVFKKSRMTLCSGVYANTNAYEIEGTIEGLTEIEKIPHFIEIDGYRGLITVKGRRPMCLNCNRLGHIRRECEYKYCKECKVMDVKTHSCLEFSEGLNYARVARKKEHDAKFEYDFGYDENLWGQESMDEVKFPIAGEMNNIGVGKISAHNEQHDMLNIEQNLNTHEKDYVVGGVDLTKSLENRMLKKSDNVEPVKEQEGYSSSLLKQHEKTAYSDVLQGQQDNGIAQDDMDYQSFSIKRKIKAAVLRKTNSLESVVDVYKSDMYGKPRKKGKPEWKGGVEMSNPFSPLQIE